jgi:hypothetical protein
MDYRVVCRGVNREVDGRVTKVFFQKVPTEKRSMRLLRSQDAPRFSSTRLARARARQITPRTEDHIIVESQDKIYLMIDYFTNVTLANSDDEILPLQFRITITLLPSRDSNQQSIRWRSRRRSNEFSKKREIVVSDQPSSTDKSKAQVESV